MNSLNLPCSCSHEIPFSCINARLPMTYGTPSTVPAIPRPGTMDRSATGRTGSSSILACS